MLRCNMGTLIGTYVYREYKFVLFFFNLAQSKVYIGNGNNIQSVLRMLFLRKNECSSHNHKSCIKMKQLRRKT